MARQRYKAEETALFPTINQAAKRLGLSAFSLRAGCKNGTIPHIKIGSDFHINMQLYLDMLNEESIANMKRVGSDA